MTYFSALPVAETQVGVGIETTVGLAVAPSYWIPVMGPKYAPNRQLLPDTTLQGSMVPIYDEIPGLRYDGHGWDSFPYLDSLGVFLRGILGSADTKTTAPGSTTLSAPAVAGATTITTTASIAAKSWIAIDTGAGAIETHYTTAVTGSYTVTLAYPLIYGHASGVTVTGLTQHQFSLLNNSPSTGNQPPSVTIVDYEGATNWRELTAAQLDSITLTGTADSLPKITTNYFANTSVQPTTPVPAFTAVEAPPGWTVVLAIGGTQITYVTSWQYDLKRNVKPIAAVTGTQSYYQFFADVLDATASFTVLEDPNSTWLNAYENGTPETVDFTLYDVKNGYALNLHTTNAKFTKGSLDRSKQWVEVPLEMQLLPTTTDALAGGVSPIVATLANAVTGTY
jgi:hypothetical protein